MSVGVPCFLLLLVCGVLEVRWWVGWHLVVRRSVERVCTVADFRLAFCEETVKDKVRLTDVTVVLLCDHLGLGRD